MERIAGHSRAVPRPVKFSNANRRTRRPGDSGRSEGYVNTILVVDDQADMAALIAHHLKADGYHTLIARSGAEARAQLRLATPDLVLLDVLMHDTNGFDLCREIKTAKETQLVSVVMITSLDSKEDRIQGIEAGCDEFLSKPVHRDELRARVHSLLKLRDARQALEQEQLAAEQAKRAAMRRTFERYVSPSVVEQILKSGGKAFDGDGGAERRDVVALFADMRGFTRMSETLAPHQVVGILNQFFGTLTEVAHRHNGTVLSMAGDCLLIGFGLPLALPSPEISALRAAREIVIQVKPLAESLRTTFDVDIGVGVGLNRGDVIVGNVGSQTYMSYTIIGDAVNVAARLTDLARSGEIVCTGSMRASADLMAEELERVVEQEVVLKGKTQPVLASRFRVK
jgi:adenylate cyclase